MLRDKLETFADSQAITGDTVSTYVMDIIPNGGAIGAGAAGGPSANTTNGFGQGTVKYLYIRVDSTLSSAGNTTSLIPSLESDDNTSLSSATVHWTGADIEEADLVTGYMIANGVPVPPGSYQRYLGVRYNVGAEEDFTAGTVTAWLSDTAPATGEQYESARLTGVD